MERRLAALAEASARIFAARSMGESLRLITEEARAIIGAHQSVTSLTMGADWAQAIQSVSLSDKYAAWRDYEAKPTGKGIYSVVCRENRPMRFTQAELEAQAGWRGFGAAKASHPPLRGWLAVPLVGRDGANLGLVQLSDKYEGEFDADDESLLVQLARFAALAVENVRPIETVRSAEGRFQEFANIGSQVLWETDAENRYTLFLAQPSFRMRRTPESFIGKTRWEALGIDIGAPPWPDYMAQIALQRPIRAFEYTTPNRDGTLYHLRLNADPMFDSAGRFAGYRGTTQDVTDLRRAEAEARASEDRFRSFAEGASDWFWETDANHRFSYLSPVGEGARRAPDVTILGRTRWQLADADPADPKWAAHIADNEAHRRFRDFEYSPRQPDGSVLDLRVSGRPHFAADGSFQGFRGTVTDVTRQHAAEAAALKAAEQYRSIVETANEGVWIVDADQRTTFVNRRMAEMLGRAPEEVVGRSAYEFRPPEDRGPRKSRWQERKQGIAEQREARFSRHDGSTFWALVNAQPLFDANGVFAGSLGMVTDITKRKEADAALKASEDRFRDFAAVGADSLWETDAEHRIVFMEGPAAVADGFAFGKRRWEYGRVDPDAPAWRRHRHDLDLRLPFRNFEYPIRDRTGGTRHFSLSGKPIFAADGTFAGYRGTTRDITTRIEADAALKASEDRFRDFAEVGSDWLWESDAEHRIVLMDGPAPIAADFALGKCRWEYSDLDPDGPMWRRHRQDLALNLPFSNFEYTLRDSTGASRHLSINGKPVFDANGKFTGYRGTTRDTSARRQAAAALQTSEDRFRDFAETGSDMLWETDAEHRFTYLSGRVVAIDAHPYGRTRWDLAGAEAGDPHWHAHIADHEARRPFRDFEYACRDAEGRMRHIAVSGNPLVGEAGRFLGYRGTGTDVTAQREAEATAREAGEKFQRMVETANEGLWTVDRDGRISFVNPRMAEMLGYEPGELVGKFVADTIPADGAAEVRKQRSERRTGEVARFEGRHLRKDGSEVPMLISTGPVFDSEGAFNGSIVMFVDITERKRAEAALQASEERFRDFAEIASDWMWETDAEHRLTYISGVIQIDNQPLGRTRWDLAGASPNDPPWREHVADLEARRPFREFDFAVRGNSGRQHHLATSGHPKFDKAGKFLGYRGTTSNRTAQREAEQAAHASEQKFQHIVETANEGLWTVDRDGRISFANRRVAEMLGYEPGELVGKAVADTVPADVAAEVRQHWSERRAGMGARFETRHLRKDGSEVWVLASATPTRDANGEFNGSIVVFVDIDDRKRAEAAQAASEQRFRDFASVASDWFWETDGEHRFSYFSPSRELTQLDGSNDSLGRTRWDYAGASVDDPAWTAHFADLAARRPFRNFEYQYRRPDGTSGTSVANGVPVFDAQGAFTGYRGTAADVTAQRAVEAAARENERKFRLFIETANEGVWMLDANMNTVYVNHRVTEMLGYTEEELLGRSYFDFKHPEELSSAKRHWEITKQQGLGRAEVRLRCKDGSELWVLLSTTPQLDDAGGFAGAFAMLVDITDRRRAEEAAARAKREIDVILASVSDGFIAMDNDLRFTYVNAAAERILGRKGNSVIGRKSIDVLEVDSNNVFDTSFIAAKQGGEPVAFTAYSDLFRIWLEVRAYPHPEGLTLFVRDVTAERQGYLALAESERKLRAALENNQSILASISDGFMALDNEWRFTFINQAAERLWHRKAEDLLGKSILDVLNVDPSNPFQSSYLESKRTGEPVALTAYSESFGKWIEVRGYPHPGGYTLFFDDVTDERTAHRALLKNQKKLEAAREMNERIFESSLDLICITDRQGNFVQVNSGAAQQLGFSAEALIGHNASEFIHPDGIEATRTALRAARQSRTLHTFENRCLRQGGTPVPMHWSVAWSEQEQKYFLIGRDMTERLETEERLNRSQRLEAIGQLTGGIAHDFNNLLTVIMGNSDMLVRALKDHDKLRRQAELSLEASRRAAELTAQLLAFARRQTLAPKAIEPNTLVTDLQELVRRTLGAQIDIVLRLAPKPWLCKIDSTQLETALLNLALNARDAMPQGGTLAIATSNRTVASDGVGSAADLPPGDYVVIDVVDTGTGMSPEVQARVFEPFYTTKDIGKGSGLGLAMVYGFVKQSGGHVALESEVGRGTTVSLYLPRATKDTVPAAAPAPRDDAPFPGGQESILVVEDDPAVRELVTDALRRLGYRVLVAGNGATARNILFGGEKVDLLFTDIMMPGGVTGAQLAAEAESRIPGLKILFTTGYAEAPAVKQMKTGPSLLRKPYRTRELALTVRHALDAAA